VFNVTVLQNIAALKYIISPELYDSFVERFAVASDVAGRYRRCW